MGATKTEQFTEQQVRIAKIAKALGHPARLAILEHLINANECVCGDIVDELPLAQSTVSQHLKELKEAGIIKGRISGVSVCYCIDAKTWKESEEIFKALFESYKDKADCC
jgi:DNA-binding transcriptional ArsR family regulator